MNWARSIKAPTGDVWHAVRPGTRAALCSRRVLLWSEDCASRRPRPTDAYACKRCSALVADNTPPAESLTA